MALDPDRKITQYRLQVWNMENGLPTNLVYAVRQTQDGYLWIGTQDGLVRFDGFDFRPFTMENTPQLKDNEIRTLYEDENGTLWIGTFSGGLTRYKDGEFTTYPTEEHGGLFNIKTISGDRWGNLWVGTSKEGLTCLSGDKFTNYTMEQGLPHNKVNDIYKDGKGDLWVTTAGGTVKLAAPGDFPVHVSQDDLPAQQFAGFYKEETKELWIGTYDSYLFQLKNGKLKVYGAESGVPSPNITYLYEDSMKNLWIGTDGGLTRMRDGVFSTLSVDDGLAAGSVSSIYEDRESSLWVGTLDGGLHQMTDSKFTTYTTREGLSHDDIQCIYQDRTGHLWIGTNKGLDRLKLKKETKEIGTLTTVLTTRQGLLNDSVVCLLEDPGGYLWIGTWEGLHRFKDGKLTTLTKRNGLCDNRISCISGDREGNTWIGTPVGLNRYSPVSKTFSKFPTKKGLSNNFTRFIFEDSGGDLWIGTDGGLNFLKDGIITAKPGMENYSFRCAHEDNEGVLWFGTGSGLVRLTSREKETGFYTYNIQSGLIENRVYSILEDDSGYLWLAGRNGISRVSKKELEDYYQEKIKRVQPELYNEKDGMKSRWCMGTACKTRDGRLWFATTMGMTMIDPNRIKTNSIPPTLVIEKIIIDGETIKTKSFSGGILKLSPGKKQFEFYYTALSFINPREIKFKIKLEGLDSDWEDMGNLRNNNYTGLSPGRYTFKVIACNSDGVWNQEGASFSFDLQPYFYQTTWFYVSVVFSILLAAFSFYRYRVRRLKARARELEMMVAQRTEQLAAANKELSRLSNLDPLTGIANRRRFMEFLTVEWQRAMRNSTAIGMIMIDVDFFKKYNDTYGHQAGDRCLKKAAEVIASAARRPGDLAARYGGEEFAVVLSDASKEGACKAAENIRTGVEAIEILHSSSPIGFVTISLGVSVTVPRRGERMENLISLADQGLYTAKEKGRNCVRFMPPAGPRRGHPIKGD